MVNRQQILAEVIASVIEIGKDYDISNLDNPTEDTYLYGGDNANLDSMGVVFLVTSLEERLSDKFDIVIALADEKAMSQRNSPFHTVARLTDYIFSLVNERE